MRTCMQFRDMNVLEHGLAVTRAFDTLMNALRTGETPAGWRIPAWLMAEPARSQFMRQCLPAETLYWYQRYHDCGKPYCLVRDAEGKSHFPDHAAVSERVWLACGGSTEVGQLIGLDMAMHLAGADDMAGLAKLPQAISLFLTALAEVHANAEMFGGFDSASFKAKAKHLDRRGRRLA